MLNAHRFECFRTTPNEKWVLAGNISGQIAVIDVDNFEMVRTYQGHAGVVHAVAVHPTLPFAASIGTDHTVALWHLEEDGGALAPLSSTSVRDVVCANDVCAVDAITSHSVALAFHDRERRLITRSGNGGVLEAAFDDAGALDLLSCVRLHADWDVQMVRYAVGSDDILSAGRDGYVVRSRGDTMIDRWQLFGDRVCHWIEHLAGNDYLVASDAGAVARLDISNRSTPVIGGRFARDDMEFVTYNRSSGRVFASSFDRGVYEIDPFSCNSKGLRYSPGYKCIWLKTLERDPSVLIAHSRNGGLYKADVDTGETLAMLHLCPPAIWSVFPLDDGSFVGAGEGPNIFRAIPGEVDPTSRTLTFSFAQEAAMLPADGYAKRVVHDPVSDRLFLGRSDGKLWAWTPKTKGRKSRCIELCDLGDAIRDLAVDEQGSHIFAVLEDGRALRVDLTEFKVIAEFQGAGRPFAVPLWALAYNADRRILAVADRESTLHLLSADDLQPIAAIPTQRVKRIKWFDADTLLYGDRDAIWAFSLSTQDLTCITKQGLQNTIEDFIWDASGRYLLAISYQCVIGLYDLNTGLLLDEVRDRMDYSKGIAWVPIRNDAYPWDFVTWGRSGDLHRYRLHEERIVSVGSLVENGAGGAAI